MDLLLKMIIMSVGHFGWPMRDKILRFAKIRVHDKLE